SSPLIGLLRMAGSSSALIFMAVVSAPSCSRHQSGAASDVLSQVVEAVADRGVEDRVADPQDDAPEDVGVHVSAELDLLAGVLGDAVADLLDDRVVERRGGRDLDRQDLVLLLPQPVEVAPDPE